MQEMQSVDSDAASALVLVQKCLVLFGCQFSKHRNFNFHIEACSVDE